MLHIGLRVAESCQQQQCANLQKHATQTTSAKGACWQALCEFTFARKHLQQHPHPESLVQDLQPAG